MKGMHRICAVALIGAVCVAWPATLTEAAVRRAGAERSIALRKPTPVRHAEPERESTSARDVTAPAAAIDLRPPLAKFAVDGYATAVLPVEDGFYVALASERADGSSAAMPHSKILYYVDGALAATMEDVHLQAVRSMACKDGVLFVSDETRMLSFDIATGHRFLGEKRIKKEKTKSRETETRDQSLSKEIAAHRSARYTNPVSGPAGKYVYASDGAAGIVALDVKTGTETLVYQESGDDPVVLAVDEALVYLFAPAHGQLIVIESIPETA